MISDHMQGGPKWQKHLAAQQAATDSARDQYDAAMSYLGLPNGAAEPTYEPWGIIFVWGAIGLVLQVTLGAWYLLG